LDTVGRDNTHHTFFEMLGNWSFGDYYKKEAIGWSWELLTKVWGLEPGRLYATYFVDDQGDLPADEESRQVWLAQPGFVPENLVQGGRKDNFWEMAETGPCGPCSEIHYDFGPEACNLKDVPGHVCEVNGDCGRIVEIWNDVFIQYNRTSPTEFQPLPKRHVDTGMGFERIVSIIQGVNGNYETDLLKPLLDETQRLAGQTTEERQANITAYRVIADHVRAATFLISDGVIPGNVGRNYVCRMIIRRAARFARNINLSEPFMAKVAARVIENYQLAYPELSANRELIEDTLTAEEQRFAETLDSGFVQLQEYIEELKTYGQTSLDGRRAFDLYATLGFPLEITRDILEESGLQVEEAGFFEAMEEHRLASSRGHYFDDIHQDTIEVFKQERERINKDLKGQVVTSSQAESSYVPYGALSKETILDSIVIDNQPLEQAYPNASVAIMVRESIFYVEGGGQITDTGVVSSNPKGSWEIRIDQASKPASDAYVLNGKVIFGHPRRGDAIIIEVDAERRLATMRNHTGTHLLHTALRQVLGDKVHQSGSA
ncbi:MAG: alanine--tRNA ligase, partial [Chloroflexi bacterium]|nr:alanine--tRNA ligase [Chloroflexota bacterium]